MDSLTQALLGASVQGALLGRWQGRKALLYGAALGTLPDLDVLIDYGDAVANMTAHRGFSHSLAVLSGFALLLTAALRRWRPHPGYGGGRLLATIWLVLVTHVLLDAFTSYGTQLWWPLATTPPVAWSSVFIIDPLYSLPLLAAVGLALVTGLAGRRARGLWVALLLSSLYLGSTLAGKQMAERRVGAELAALGLPAERLFSAPTPFNSLLWRVVALDGEHYHEAVVGWFDRAPPTVVTLPRGARLAAHLQANPAHARLLGFTGGFLRYDRLGDALVVTDLRLGMTGYHPFRFPLAHRQDGRWLAAERPQRLPARRPEPERLQQLWARLWHSSPPLPLAQWADGLSAAQDAVRR